MLSRKFEIFYKNEKLQVEYFHLKKEKRTVLYLHGLGCSKDDFEGAARLLNSCTLTAFDLPGCGNSPYPGNMTLGIDDLVEITNIVINKLDIRDPVIAGHSMGGLVALLYILKYGNGVKAFINIEGNLVPEDCFFSRKVAGHNFTDFRNRIFKQFRQSLAGFPGYAKSLERVSEKAYFDYSASLVEHSENMDLLQRFIELSIPRLFVYGSNRKISYLAKLKDSGCELAGIPDSDHFPFYDNPIIFYREILNFLGRLD